MKDSDISRLSRPYECDPNEPGPGASSALGVDVPTWGRLTTAILQDLRTEPPYGIGWWAPHPGTSRRVLISDQLFACSESVSTNMIEAAVHWLEFLDFADRLSDRFVDAVRIENGVAIMKAPRARTPLEDLSVQMVRLHIAGTARALAGALDCMAGVMIGVLSLPRSILKADFNSVRGMLNKMAANKAPGGAQVQANFAQKFEGLVRSAGPPEWLDWELAFRNMLVHRGRRIDFGQYLPRTPVLYDQLGQAIPRVRVVNQLPRDPGRSDVEVFLEPAKPLVLTEDAGETLNGLLHSTRSLIEGTAQQLLEVWNWRRENPNALSQPAAQWPNGPSTDAIAFSGYAPGSVAYSPDMMSTHPVVTKRMSAAALFDQARDQWKTFD